MTLFSVISEGRLYIKISFDQSFFNIFAVLYKMAKHYGESVTAPMFLFLKYFQFQYVLLAFKHKLIHRFKKNKTYK